MLKWKAPLARLENVIKLDDALEEPNAVPVIVTKLKADELRPDAGFGAIR